MTAQDAAHKIRLLVYDPISPNETSVKLEKAIEEIINEMLASPSTPRPTASASFVCDVDKMAEHGIRLAPDTMDDRLMMPATAEMRRAMEVGAIWLEDENGNRLSSDKVGDCINDNGAYRMILRSRSWKAGLTHD